MATILDVKKIYRKKIDHLDLELIIAHATRKSREFILTHPEREMTKRQETITKKFIERRIKHEPLAYILGEKEFYGLRFKVDENTLIPRPETEMMVDLVLKKKQEVRGKGQGTIITDIGTGSGNIIIAIVDKLLKHKPASSPTIRSGSKSKSYIFYGTDISAKALAIAKYNAKMNKVDDKIKFLHGSLLHPIIHDPKFVIHNQKDLIITANLPYLSPRIFVSCSRDIKNYEPKSALISQKEGLAHYDKLLEQIRTLHAKYKIQIAIFVEISPEQKTKISKLIKRYFPETKIIFHKDLGGRWRICELEIFNR